MTQAIKMAFVAAARTLGLTEQNQDVVLLINSAPDSWLELLTREVSRYENVLELMRSQLILEFETGAESLRFNGSLVVPKG